MSDTVVVPDSIEPYIGYKALNVRRGSETARLESPSQRMLWPRQKKAVATHPGYATEWGWVLVTEDTPFSYDQDRTTGLMPVTHPTQVSAQNFNQVVNIEGQYYVSAPPPPDSAPKGMRWAWQQTKHQTGEKGCGCGIYVVADMNEALGYFSEQAVIVSVALWGTVTKASRGARGEFGYPQEIIAWSCERDLAETVADGYGIPIDRKREFEKHANRWGTANNPGTTTARMALRSPAVLQAVTFPPAERHPTRPLKRPFSGRFIGLRVGAFGILTFLASFPAGLIIGPLASVFLSLLLLAGWLLYMKHLFK